MLSVRRKDTVVCEKVGPEAILYDPEAEEIYILDEIGLTVWSLLGNEKTVDDLYTKLAEMYGEEKASIENDTAPFIAALVEKGLLEYLK